MKTRVASTLIRLLIDVETPFMLASGLHGPTAPAFQISHLTLLPPESCRNAAARHFADAAIGATPPDSARCEWARRRFMISFAAAFQPGVIFAFDWRSDSFLLWQ